MLNIESLEARYQILKDINTGENIERKRISLKNSDVYNKNQEPYVMEKLRKEFDADTIQGMRKIFSINLTEKIVNEMACLYKDEPERTFSVSEGELSESQQKQLENIYKLSKADVKFKSANKKDKLQNQGTIQVVPSGDKIIMRVLQPHHFDVIPNELDPEIADAYIISSFDQQANRPRGDGSGSVTASDLINQAIGDTNDQDALKERYIWWTKEFNFTTDGKGNFVGDVNKNPVEKLPFVDFSKEKEFSYWVNVSSDIVEFSLDFSLLLSDTATINRLQGYSQSILYAKDKPESIRVGPTQTMFIKIDTNSADDKTRFEFATPNPDMESALNLLDIVINLFLTSIGEDPSVISSKGEVQKYASGIDRLLGMLGKFERSKDDMDKFRDIENNVLDLFVKWSNAFQGVLNNPLNKKLQLGKLPEDVEVSVQFQEPQMIQSKSELEDSVIKRLEKKLITHKNALKEIYGLEDDAAEDLKKEIDEESALKSGDEDEQNDEEKTKETTEEIEKKKEDPKSEEK